MYLHVNEITGLLVNVLCWVHSYRYFGRKLEPVFFFFSGAILLGTFSETAAILMTGGYQYKGFWWNIGPVPLFIAVGWGAAFYFPYVFSSNMLRFLESKKSYTVIFGVLCGLIALFIDMWYDPLAVELKWWTWANGGSYYGVPTSNFVGWFVFAGLFCPSFRFISKKTWSTGHKILIYLLLLVGVFTVTALVSFPFFAKK